MIGSVQKDWGEVVVPSGDRQLFVQDRSHNMQSVLLRLYRAGIDPASFDAVYSTDEWAVVAASLFGAAFGVPSLPPRVAATFRDKSLQKTAVRAAGVPVADFMVIEDLSDLPEDFSLPYPRAVLKPVAAGGTEDTSLITCDADLRAAADRLRSQHWVGRQLRTFILEEFVPGEELHVDGVVFDGQVQFVSVGAYRAPCLSAVTESLPLTTSLFDPVDDAAIYDLVVPVAKRSVAALGLEAGVFHMELFHDEESGRLVFGECAARRGGGLVQEEVLHKFGVSLAHAAIQCALGIDPALKPEVRPGAVGHMQLPYVPGTLLSCPSAKDLMALPNVEFATIEIPSGYVMGRTGDTVSKIGSLMLTAGSQKEMYQRADEIHQWFLDRVVASPLDVSPAQLRAWNARQEARRAGEAPAPS
ncbi:ATP-grasp domain-containing protein [Streptomyces sp. NPDC000987]|uniref:ATP-grasp domain-containing protein n=1 Tax=Streptomyces sp. NPDC000987 TaxID=3154374 RepID=UPI00332C6C8F